MSSKKPIFSIKDISNNKAVKVNENGVKGIKIKTESSKIANNKQYVKNKDKLIKEIQKEKELSKGQNTQENNTTNDKKESVKKDKQKNNRYSLSKKMLKQAEYTLDQLLIDDDDLGIDTIVKTKRGIKKSLNIAKKNFEISKKVSDKVKYVYLKKKENRQSGQKKQNEQKKQNGEKEQKTSRSSLEKNKDVQKQNSLTQRQRKEWLKQAKKKAREKVENVAKVFVAKLKGALESLITKKVLLVGLIIITLIVTLVSAVVGITTLFAYSVNLSLDDNVTMITEYISELDTNINAQIDFAETNYPYVDRFIYNVPQRARTNQEQVYAYLKAKYGDEKISETVIKAEIKQIHDNLYDLKFDEKTRTWTETKEDGTEVRHSRTTMTITLTTKTFFEFYEENKDSLLKEHQQKDYENILKLMKENVGKILNNPFPKVDWRNYVTSEYGYRIHPITNEITMHNGLDIALSEGTDIYACMSGKVKTFNEGDSGFGLYLTITNGKHKTLYAHCSEILVTDGQKVNAGDKIAKVGSTGLSTGAHLHLEYFVNEVRKNPRAYLKIYEE